MEIVDEAPSSQLLAATFAAALMVGCQPIPFDGEGSRAAMRIDNGDGTYSLPAPPGLVIGDRTTDPEGVLTWEYTGQTRYAYDPQPITSGESVVEPVVLRTTGDHLLGTARTDRNGSRWVVVAADEDGIAGILDAAAAESTEGEDADVLPAAVAVAAPPRQDDLPIGAIDRVTFESWSTVDCGPENVHLWNGESRSLISPPSNQTEAAVLVQSPVGSCTGTILRERFVLTAAHCVTDLVTHDPFDPPEFIVTRVDDTNDSPAVVQVFVDDDWVNGSGEVNDDYALLEVDPFAAGFVDMDISNATDATLSALAAAHNIAVDPMFADGLACTDPGLFDVYHNSADPLGSIYTYKINLKIDGVHGHSGGPVYYCPAGDDVLCLPGEKGFVIAVWSAWDIALTTHRGPKGPAFYAWAQILMNTN